MLHNRAILGLMSDLPEQGQNLANPSLIPVEPEAKPPHRFTKANARSFALMSKQARLAYREARLYPKPTAGLNDQATPALPTDPYLSARLIRVRRQLDRIDRMMLDEDDPSKLDRLASAQARLAEQERLAADRSLPGSRRPAPEKQNAGRSTLLQPSDPPPNDAGGRAEQE